MEHGAYHINDQPGEESHELMFSRFFRAHYSKLVFYAFQITNDTMVAEDLVQACFISLWQKKLIRDGQASLYYMYGAIRKAAAKYARDRHYHDDISKVEFADPSEDIERVIRTETFDFVYKSFALLPPKCRRIFKMLFVEGKSYAEIAEELQITESTVRTQKAKGIAIIKNQLKGVLAWLIMLLAGVLKGLE